MFVLEDWDVAITGVARLVRYMSFKDTRQLNSFVDNVGKFQDSPVVSGSGGWAHLVMVLMNKLR